MTCRDLKRNENWGLNKWSALVLLENSTNLLYHDQELFFKAINQNLLSSRLASHLQAIKTEDFSKSKYKEIIQDGDSKKIFETTFQTNFR